MNQSLKFVYGMVWYGMVLVRYDKPYSKTLASARQQFVGFHEGRRTIEVLYKKTIYRNYIRDKKMCRNFTIPVNVNS